MHKFFKIFGLILLLAAIGCEENDPCYDFPANEDDCKAKSQCTYVVAGNSNLIVNNTNTDPDLTTFLSWYGLDFKNEPGVCTSKNNKQAVNCDSNDCENFDQEQSYCIKILYFYFCGDFLDPPSPIWITFEELQENLNGNYSPVCGNGVIEFGEQCDGSQLGTMSDCATHGSITGAGNWTSGEITCNEYYCYWEYDNCQ